MEWLAAVFKVRFISPALPKDVSPQERKRSVLNVPAHIE